MWGGSARSPQRPLTVTRDGVTLSAGQPNGLFYGVQTIRQLLPWAVEHRGAFNRRLWLPGAHVVDKPRFAWRGAMLDVSRHFIDGEAVKRYIDFMALYQARVAQAQGQPQGNA